MKTILKYISGSNLTGTAVEEGVNSDVDITGIYIESPDKFIGFNTEDFQGFRTKPEHVRSGPGDVDSSMYGLKKYLGLAIKGNPTLLLALFVPKDSILEISEEGVQLQNMADKILSKHLYHPFIGYMTDQTKRLEGTLGQLNVHRPELIAKYGFDTKYAGHIIRLGLQGIEVLKEGRLCLPMKEENRKLVIDIRIGKYPLSKVLSLANDLHRDLKAAYNSSSLPEFSDRRYIENWMINAYLNYWNDHGSEKRINPNSS